MPGVGTTFVGCIGVGPQSIVPPTALTYAWDHEAGGTNFPLTHGPASPTSVGDLMVVTLTGYSLDGAQGADGTVTPDPAWTAVASEVDPSSPRQIFRVYTKTAGASDADGTASYSWGMDAGTGTYGAVACFTIRQANGTTLSAPATQTARDTAAYAVAAPAGDWTLACFLHKEHRTGSVDHDAHPTITNAGTTELIRFDLGGGVRGEHVICAVPASEATVTGALESSAEPTASLIVFGVT